VDVNDFKSAFKMVVSQGLRNSAQVGTYLHISAGIVDIFSNVNAK